MQINEQNARDGRVDPAVEPIYQWRLKPDWAGVELPWEHLEAKALEAAQKDATVEVRTLYAHPPASERADFQRGVDCWMEACFGAEIKADQVERADRFIEEALELAQTMPGFSRERAHALVDYVFGRPQGEINQEVGGVMVTLAALCNTAGVRIDDAAQIELARVWTKVEQIRAKQAAKPTGSALPIAHPPAPAPAQDDASERADVRALVEAAYIAGATAVHEHWLANPGEAPRGDPEFGEAASDYAAALNPTGDA